MKPAFPVFRTIPILLTLLYPCRIFSAFPEPAKTSIQIIDRTSDSITLEMNCPPAEYYSIDGKGYELEIPGEGHISVKGRPSLPQISRLIGIPGDGDVRIECVPADSVVYENFDLLPEQENPLADYIPDGDLVCESSIYSGDRLFPENPVDKSVPAMVYGQRVVRFTVYPYRYNPVKKILVYYPELQVIISFTGGSGINTIPGRRKPVPRNIYNYLAGQIVNFDELDVETDTEMGALLIISPDNPTIVNYVQTLAEWKRRKGFTVVTATLTQTGSTAQAIRAFLQNVYATWTPQLRYVILIGDCAGAIAVPASNPYGDHDYSRLDGDDILADVAVGRFSCENTTQLLTEINKVISYESNPYMGETAWYKKGAVVANESSSGISTIQTKRGVRYKAVVLNNYTSVDTLWYTMSGSLSTFTSNNINSGIGFYNYRGYVGMSGWSNSNINALTNYFKLPFVATITCETGNITTAESEIVEEFFRVGTPNSPTGAIAAIGTATDATHTRHNNCVDNGIFAAFYDYDIFAFGDALNTGKYDLYMNYPDNPSSVEDFSNWNNLIGDPSCQLWTDIPKKMTITYQSSLPVGMKFLEVVVTDSITGAPLENAEVCLYGTGVHLFQLSDSEGRVFFTLPPIAQGNMKITCCLHNYKPHLGTISFVSAPVYVSYNGYIIIETLTINISEPNVSMNWEDITGAAVYHIYRSTEPYFVPSPQNLLTSVTASQYLDAGAAAQNHLYYIVTWE